MANHKLWGGLFEASLEGWVEEFGCASGFDYRLSPYDLEGSSAHVKNAGSDRNHCSRGSSGYSDRLGKLLARYEAGELYLMRNEDIHMNMEALLTEEIGPVAVKLRSLSCIQVATDGTFISGIARSD